ncbi:MAG: hypothetical protein AUK03_13915 [Anaerolineae bacterium CG2_30_64_16]|nr:MAG: hypothetical protein AUK03_13915 [Anaerolineae bacterium CG2_30_64_16]
MSNRLRQITADYPKQFWILFWGLLVNSTGGSMVWPFLTIFMREQLAIPLTTVTLLFTVNSAAGLVATSFAGPTVDRLGRKRVMVLSLAGSSVVLLGMSRADSLAGWVVMMILNGALGPLYRVGSDAMVADLVEPEQRASAYALLRMINNLGIAVGPMAGGFITSVSYSLAFYAAAGAHLIFGGLIALAVRETLTRAAATASATPADGGYGPVLRDRPFVAFVGVYTLAVIPSALLMMLLAVYAKENFGVPESQYGFIMATNALMVVLFQYAVTHVSQRRPHLLVLTVGTLFYAVGVGSVALGRGFWAFWLSMVIATIGELLIVPTATALTANLAPPDMRGRYMGLYGLTWGVAFGIGPVVGGYLNDHIAPVTIWYSGLAIGLAAALGFVLLGRRLRVGGTG